VRNVGSGAMSDTAEFEIDPYFEQAPVDWALVRWTRLLGQVGGEVKLIPDVIMPPVWSSDHGGHAPRDLFL